MKDRESSRSSEIHAESRRRHSAREAQVRLLPKRLKGFKLIIY